MEDPAFQPRQPERWRDVLPQAEVVQLARAGHWPHEEALDEVASAIGRVLLPAQ
jgi:pimeloyl-ACP methyl ester carboxylesterase